MSYWNRHYLSDLVIEIRTATPADAKGIQEHWATLNAFARGFFEGKPGPLPSRPRIAAWIQREETLVATLPGGEIVGYVAYQPYSDPDHRDWASVALSVGQQWWRNGIGRLLAEAIRDVARDAGFRHLVADPNRGNTRSIALCESLGGAAPTECEDGVNQYVFDI